MKTNLQTEFDLATAKLENWEKMKESGKWEGFVNLDDLIENQKKIVTLLFLKLQDETKDNVDNILEHKE